MTDKKQTDEILKDIMAQLPHDEYVSLINKLPTDFFQVADEHRQRILKEVRHAILHDCQRDSEELAGIVRRYISDNFVIIRKSIHHYRDECS